MSRRHSFRGRQRDCTGAPVNRSSSKYLVGVGEHEPNPIDGHDDYDSRKYEFCETILRHRTNSENKAAERIMIARGLCHAGSGWGAISGADTLIALGLRRNKTHSLS